MKAMETILSKITLSIPSEILNMIINHDTKDEDNTITMQNYIQEYIIDRYVLTELNTQCGQSKKIELKREYIMENVTKKYDETVTLYKIPLSVSERPIVATRGTNLTHGDIDLGFSDYYLSRNTIGTHLESMLNSHTFEYEERRARTEILDNNIIKLYDCHNDNIKLNCTIGFDNNFTNIPDQAIPHLTNYIIVILKKHIYNTFSLSIDIDRIISGIEVEVIQNILDDYKSQTEDEIIEEKLMAIKSNILIFEPESLAATLQYAL